MRSRLEIVRRVAKRAAYATIISYVCDKDACDRISDLHLLAMPGMLSNVTFFQLVVPVSTRIEIFIEVLSIISFRVDSTVYKCALTRKNIQHAVVVGLSHLTTGRKHDNPSMQLGSHVPGYRIRYPVCRM
jgi:hypothetical protein